MLVGAEGLRLRVWVLLELESARWGCGTGFGWAVEGFDVLGGEEGIVGGIEVRIVFGGERTVRLLRSHPNDARGDVGGAQQVSKTMTSSTQPIGEVNQSIV